MTTNPYLNLFNRQSEQNLLDSLLIESIRSLGMDMYYLPRRRVSFNEIFYEDNQSVYDTAYLLEMYMKTSDNFYGPGAVMGPMAFMQSDNIVFTISITRFATEITQKEPLIIRPNESDLLYFPMNQRLFKIMEVNNKPFFYQLGELQLYDCTCENYRASNEIIRTGIAEIDSVYGNYSINVLDYAEKDSSNNYVLDANGNYVLTDKYEENMLEFDPLQDNKTITDEAANVNLIDWTERNPFNDEGTY